MKKQKGTANGIDKDKEIKKNAGVGKKKHR